MKRLFLVVSTAIVVLPWLAGASAQAEDIHWTASGSYTLPAADGSVVPSLPNFPYPLAGIQMWPGLYGTGTNAVSGTNSGSVPVVQLNSFISTGLWNGTDYEFGRPFSQYQLNLLLRDQASGASGTLTFRGFFSGELGGPGVTTLSNTFIGPTTQTLNLGSDLYTVTIGPAVLPQEMIFFPPWTDSGSISASISVQPASNSAPEPSSLVLACLGLPSLGLTGWFRRRKGVDNNASNA